MKLNTLFLLFFIPSIVLSQEILFSKDSLYFSNQAFENTDSIWIYNYGNDTLKVDSINSVNYMGYGIEILFSDSLDIMLNTVYPETGFSLSAHDSAMIIFWNPDICPICKISGYEFFNDTIVFINNSLNNAKDSIPSSGFGFLFGDDDVAIDDKNENDVLYELFQNYPNPFNPQTIITYGLKEPSNVILTIYDNIGREITILVNKHQNAGYHQVVWDGSNFLNQKVSSGVYYYRLKTEKFTSIKKMVFIK